MLKTYPRLYLHKYTGYILSIHIPLLSLGKSVFSSTNAYSDCIILVLLIQSKSRGQSVLLPSTPSRDRKG